MLSLFRVLMDVSLLRPILRPVTRLIVSFIAVPFFRTLTRRVLRIETLDAELEKDLEQWFRGALLLLFATQNIETTIFPWVQPVIQARYVAMMEDDGIQPAIAEEQAGRLEVRDHEAGWILLGLRVMLAIGVVQMMPDQELFGAIHNGPPKLQFDRKKKWWPQIRSQAWPMTRGYLCLHLNRSSPVFAILATIAPGTAGWVCYGMALTQYLIIGLVTSRDKALNVLSVFDESFVQKRKELIEEFHLEKEAASRAAPAIAVASPDSSPAKKLTQRRKDR